MASSNTLSDDFTTGNIAGKMLRFMLPVLGALVLQAMYGAVDLLVVGQFGSNEGISAVATGSNIINLMTFVVTGLTMGVTVLISRYLGEGNQKKIGPVIGSAICFFILLALGMMALSLAGAPLFVTLLQAPREAYQLTIQYVRICGAGMVFVVAYNVISGIFRGLGNSRLPLLFVAIACVVNILGDLLFVAVFQMNVAGAALATVLAQAVSVVLSVWIIRRQKLPFQMSRKDLRFSGEIGRFLKLGFPIALQDLLTNISFLILCAIVNSMGLAASSGYGIAQKVTAFIMLIPSALMQSMSAFVGQNVGAGKEDRARKSMYTGMGIGAAIGAVIFLIAFFCGEIPSALFTSNPEFIARSAEYLRGFSPEAILTCVVFSYIGFFNGHGKTIPVMLQGITASFLVRVPLSYLFSLQPGANLVTIGLAVPIASLYGILFFSVCYLRHVRGTKKEMTAHGSGKLTIV